MGHKLRVTFGKIWTLKLQKSVERRKLKKAQKPLSLQWTRLTIAQFAFQSLPSKLSYVLDVYFGIDNLEIDLDTY